VSADIAAAIDRAYEQKLRAGAAFHALQVSKRASKRRLEQLAAEFDSVGRLLREAAELIPQSRRPDDD